MIDLDEVQAILDKYGVTDDILTEQLAEQEVQRRRAGFRLIVTAP